MTKDLSAARAILVIPKDASSWNCIKEKRDPFIWTDDDDTVKRWNEITAKSKLPRVGHRIDTSGKREREFLTYKGKTVEVPLTHSRDDRIVILHTLGRLIMGDSDIRFCLDSYHSSDLAFLALPPDDWKALETEFGRKAVAYRFLAFPKDLKEFYDQAFSEKNNREYPADAPDTSAEEQMARELAEYIKELLKPRCPSVEVLCELELEAARVLRVKIRTQTDDQRDALSKERKRHKQIVDMAKKRCAEHDISLTMAHIQSYETVKRDWKGEWRWGNMMAYYLYSLVGKK